MNDINTIVTGIATALSITKRLSEISKSVKNAEFKNLLADLSNRLADTRLEVVDLKIRICEIEEENLKLKEENKKICSQKSENVLSEQAIAILKKCKENDITEFEDILLARELGLNKLEFETGMGELREKRLIQQFQSSMRVRTSRYTGDTADEGVRYRILQEGLNYMLSMETEHSKE